ncbi:uncharacterized protein [Nicotiana tomentosiformis]|uniref:uncharacterized protein n=1 Tax=Nicotiana tomentosiformis TaxID=4098 RepID=UPI00388C520F
MPPKATAAQKCKSVADETTSRAPPISRARGESHGEIPSQTSHTPPSPDDLRGAPAPVPAPIHPGHVMRDYPTRGGASLVQPAGSVAGLSSLVRPPGQGSQEPMGRGRGRGRASSSSCPQNRIYALAGSTLSYVTLLVASKFGIEPELIKPVEVSTPFGDPVISRRVYKNCIVVVHSRSTVADLIELDMVEFDVILGIDWLVSCYANVDCRSKMARFQFSGEPVLEWKGNTTSPRGRFISYLKAGKMIIKVYIYHLVRVQDVKVESPIVQSIPVVNEFSDVFPDELSGLPPE